MFGLFNNKKNDLPKELATITTDEKITLQCKVTGKEFSFYIGQSSDSKYWALTTPDQVPKFCFEAKDFDDAFSKGTDAITYYMGVQETK